MEQKLLEQGLDVFDDHNVLELLLFYSVPRKDMNPLAHELLNTFGSLEAVFEAPAEELSKVNGIGESTVTLLKLFPEVSRRYVMDKNRFDNILDSTKRPASISPHAICTSVTKWFMSYASIQNARSSAVRSFFAE